MKKEANVADGERGDVADFLVTEVALELEVNHLALVGWQLLEVAGDRKLLVFDGCHASRLLPRIQRKIPAHREQPRRKMSFEPRRIFPAQAQKGLLHDVPRRLQIAEEPFRVADQRPLVSLQRIGNPGGFRCPAHSVSMEDNDTGAHLLEFADEPSVLA